MKFFQCPGILEQRVLLRHFRKVIWKLVKGSVTLTQLYFQSIELITSILIRHVCISKGNTGNELYNILHKLVDSSFIMGY